MIIVYLPPNIDTINSDNIYKSGNIHQSRDPQVSIKRIHKSMDNSLIIYEIEPITHESNDCQAITSVSSQLDASQIRKFYFELNFTPIDHLSSAAVTCVNLFGVLLEMSRARNETACTELVLFDFEVGRRVLIKLWRGLAAWHSSLSLGSRLQIRSLTLKQQGFELHSSSVTEIILLAHGPGGNGKPVSGRARMLNEKESLILNFLNHQSLSIPQDKLTDMNINLFSNRINLIGPFYLEYLGNNQPWILQGYQYTQPDTLTTVNFIHLDAKIWQIFLEVIDKIGSIEFTIQFDNLVEFNFNSSSSLYHFPSLIQSINRFKSIDWIDLCSSHVVLYGVYTLEAVVDGSAIQGSSEESLGNLSVLPDSYTSNSLRLKCPYDDKYFIYPENDRSIGEKTNEILSFLIRVKTTLNDGNFNEIISKNVYIIKTNK